MPERANPTPEHQANQAALNRRAHVRHSCNQEAFFQPAPQPSGDLWWQARSCDVAVRRLALVPRRRFGEGTLLDVQLPPEEGSAERILLARVARVIQQDDGTWLIGCKFISRLDDVDLRGLLQGG